MSTGHCWHETGMRIPICCRCYDNTITIQDLTVQAWEVCEVTLTTTAMNLLKMTRIALTHQTTPSLR